MIFFQLNKAKLKFKLAFVAFFIGPTHCHISDKNIEKAHKAWVVVNFVPNREILMVQHIVPMATTKKGKCPYSKKKKMVVKEKVGSVLIFER